MNAQVLAQINRKDRLQQAGSGAVQKVMKNVDFVRSASASI
jgi:hypothetical protein